MSKYKKIILEVLDTEKIKSTNQVLKEVEKKTGKVINWHALYRVLMELTIEGKVEKFQADAGFFWRRTQHLDY